MNLTLTRNRQDLYGIFGKLTDEVDNGVCITLEHAFKNPDGTYSPALPPGTYLCVRGQHRLPDKPITFETFEVTGVPGHTGILFHKGNTNNDSEGCLLLGESIGAGCILESGIAFGHFLDIQVGCDSFQLVVEN